MLQSDLEKLSRWSHDWKMKFNYEKCKTLYFGPKARIKTVYNLTDRNTDCKYDLAETDCERDLEIYIINNLKWSTQAKKAVNKANSILGMLKRTFIN